MKKGTYLLFKYFFSVILLCFSINIGLGQATGLTDAILDESCAKIFKKYVKPGHVINFESPEAALDGKFILLSKDDQLSFAEAKATPRNSSKLSLKTIPNQKLVAMRDEKGQLIARLKIEVKKDGSKVISCPK